MDKTAERIKYTGKPGTEDWGVGELQLLDVAQHDGLGRDDRRMPDDASLRDPFGAMAGMFAIGGCP